MKRAMRKGVTFAIISALVALTALAASVPKAGEVAPALMLRDMTGKMVYLSDFCGRRCPMANRRTTVVHFFATHCKPCLKEIPAIKRLRNAFRKSDLAILIISVADSKKAVIKYKQEKGLTAIFLLDKYGANARRWGIFVKKGNSTSFSLPYTFLVSKDGIVRAALSGAHENLDQLLVNKIRKMGK